MSLTHIRRAFGGRLALPDRAAIGNPWKVALLAMLFGAACGYMIYRRAMPTEQNDWSIIYFGAKALVHGSSPYAAVGPGRAFAWGYPLLYPLPAILVGAPLTVFSAPVASATFAGLSAALLLFGLVQTGQPHRLLVIASAPFVYAMSISQWSTALTAAALAPAFGFLLAAKPTLGAALFAYRPTWRTLLGGVAIVALSFVVDPTWVVGWREALRTTQHLVIPIAHGAGPLVLLALLRWRRPESRLLVAMACVPQTAIIYEALPLALIPGNAGEMSIFVALSWVAYAWWHATGMHMPLLADQIPVSLRIVTVCLYLPCVALILLRPNKQPQKDSADTGSATAAPNGSAAAPVDVGVQGD